MKVVSRQYSLHPGTIYKHSEEDDCIWRHRLFKSILLLTESPLLARGDDGYLPLSSSSTETPSTNSLLRCILLLVGALQPSRPFLGSLPSVCGVCVTEHEVD
ncbi:hypothetical protein AcW1_004927 [Taiwanofungus camphoratus]|nr:hypothetical protein AcW1_004927 [Antrodia cinnamomea]